MNKEHTNKHAHSAAEDIKDAISDSGEHIKQVSSQLIEELSEFLDAKKDELSGMHGKCKNYVKANPFTTILGAVAVGALLGILLKK